MCRVRQLFVPLAAALLLAGLVFGQEPQDADSTAAEAARCDSAWDGVLFGVLPGTLVGTFWGALTFAGETQDGPAGGEIIALGGGIGALVGYTIDAAACHSQQSEDAETEALLYRIQNGEAIPRVAVVTRNGERLVLLEPFVTDGTLRGRRETVALSREEVRRLSIPKSYSPYVVVGAAASVVALYVLRVYANSD